jgi:hypothetical protein
MDTDGTGDDDVRKFTVNSMRYIRCEVYVYRTNTQSICHSKSRDSVIIDTDPLNPWISIYFPLKSQRHACIQTATHPKPRGNQPPTPPKFISPPAPAAWIVVVADAAILGAAAAAGFVVAAVVVLIILLLPAAPAAAHPQQVYSP